MKKVVIYGLFLALTLSGCAIYFPLRKQSREIGYIIFNPNPTKIKKIALKDLNLKYHIYSIKINNKNYKIYSTNPLDDYLDDIKVNLLFFDQTAHLFNLKIMFSDIYIICREYLPESFAIYHNSTSSIVTFKDIDHFWAGFIGGLATELHESMHDYFKQHPHNLRWFEEGTCNIPELIYYSKIKKLDFDGDMFDKWLIMNKKNFLSIYKWKEKPKIPKSRNDLKEMENKYPFSTYVCFRLYLINPSIYIQIVHLINEIKKPDFKDLNKLFQENMGISLGAYEIIMQRSQKDFVDFLKILYKHAIDPGKKKTLEKLIFMKDSQTGGSSVPL